MKYLGITLNGLEDVSSDEIKKIGKVIKKEEGIVIFESDKENFNDLRSVERVLMLIDKFNFKDLESFESKVNIIDFSLIKGTFKVDCKRIGEHNFNSVDVSRAIGEVLFEKYNKKVDFKNPKEIIFVHINKNKCFIGIDLTGKISRRDYRFKVHSSSINAILAYSLISLSNLKDDETLVDLFCGDGIIPIEACFYKKSKAIGFDNREGYLKSCRINNKIAGKNAEFYNLNMLNEKLKGKEVDKVVSHVPSHTKRIGENLVVKIYENLFNRLNKILKDDGRCVFLSYSRELLLKKAEDYEFKLVKELVVKGKERDEYLLVFEKV